ncbi:uncharacterized protein LAESUDRAFT_174670 [Laetiporus sulphureus 93-53]|uniref:Uncharacterized protein n=1 Tax=Laetiporus sulphureus 93-53 TaxID=1314785 RepID=A0A165HX33_9APHY|nr:uncharacterized protein LAESUDRAFT_174670 [Laetiporus sulphureus 93-53]KZT12303.1 hypothetical protein LAESUDRAFT_174670 [Laetiporus sulphureus 93-53]
MRMPSLTSSVPLSSSPLQTIFCCLAQLGTAQIEVYRDKKVPSPVPLYNYLAPVYSTHGRMRVPLSAPLPLHCPPPRISRRGQHFSFVAQRPARSCKESVSVLPAPSTSESHSSTARTSRSLKTSPFSRELSCFCRSSDVSLLLHAHSLRATSDTESAPQGVLVDDPRSSRTRLVTESALCSPCALNRSRSTTFCTFGRFSVLYSDYPPVYLMAAQRRRHRRPPLAPHRIFTRLATSSLVSHTLTGL